MTEATAPPTPRTGPNPGATKLDRLAWAAERKMALALAHARTANLSGYEADERFGIVADGFVDPPES